MTEGLIALLIGSGSAIVTTLIVQLVMRRNTKEANDTDRFEAILEGQDRRIKTLEGEVSDLQNKRAMDHADLARLRGIVRAWFVELKAAWVDQPSPMPMPPADDLEFLGITDPRK